MRKKKHLRDKLEARSKVSNKRDEFEDGIDNRKPPLPVEKGKLLDLTVFSRTEMGQVKP